MTFNASIHQQRQEKPQCPKRALCRLFHSHLHEPEIVTCSPFSAEIISIKSGYYYTFPSTSPMAWQERSIQEIRLLKEKKKFKTTQNHASYNYKPNLKNKYSTVNTRGSYLLGFSHWSKVILRPKSLLCGEQDFYPGSYPKLTCFPITGSEAWILFCTAFPNCFLMTGENPDPHLHTKPLLMFPVPLLV